MWSYFNLIYLEIGYLFRKSSWKKGYATESLKYVSDLITKNTNIDFLVGCTGEKHINSIKVLEKAGFIYVDNEPENPKYNFNEEGESIGGYQSFDYKNKVYILTKDHDKIRSLALNNSEFNLLVEENSHIDIYLFSNDFKKDEFQFLLFINEETEERSLIFAVFETVSIDSKFLLDNVPDYNDENEYRLFLTKSSSKKHHYILVDNIKSEINKEFLYRSSANYNLRTRKNTERILVKAVE